MSLNATTLNGAITADQTTIRLASGSVAAVGSKIRVDDEEMEIQSVDLSPSFRVMRGINGTFAASHETDAIVNVGPSRDFPPRLPAREYSYDADGAIAVRQGRSVLLGSAAQTMTLRDPLGNENGIEMEIISNTAQAHTVDNGAGSGFNAGGAGADLATWGGAIGDSLRIRAVGGRWLVLNATNVTLS